MKYKIGETVRTKKYGDPVYNNGNAYFLTDMQEYCDKEFVIRSHREHDNLYTLEGATHELVNGDGYWLWDELWLEPVELYNEVKEINEEEFANLFA